MDGLRFVCFRNREKQECEPTPPFSTVCRITSHPYTGSLCYYFIPMKDLDEKVQSYSKVFLLLPRNVDTDRKSLSVSRKGS